MTSSDATDAVRIRHQTLDELREDSGVVVNLETLEYVELDRVGTAMWQALRATGSVGDSVALLQQRFDAPAEVLDADLRRFVAQLEAVGLVGTEAAPAAGPIGGEGDREGAEPGDDEPADPCALYLDLLERSLLGMLDLSREYLAEHHHLGTLAQGRQPGGDGLSMIGLARMRNVRALCERALADGIPGDLMETGVWRGGAVVMMRGVLAAHGERSRRVWVADSFEGLPEPDLDSYPIDAFWSSMSGGIAVSRVDVERAFAAYGLLDEQVRFLPGWFRDTLPTAPVEALAVLRLDGDLYESTMDALTHLYPRVSPGGYVIVDDYSLATCRQAVHDYRAQHAITAELVPIDWASVWWQKPADA